MLNDLIGSYLFLSLLPKDPPYVEDMSEEQLQQEIKRELEEIGKRDEVFVVIIDAINQVIISSMFFAGWDFRTATGREQHF